jgi:hypothetical protein
MNALRSIIKSQNAREIRSRWNAMQRSLTHLLKDSINPQDLEREKDELATGLLPDDLPPDYLYIGLKTTGNGNCLYNAASKKLAGIFKFIVLNTCNTKYI